MSAEAKAAAKAAGERYYMVDGVRYAVDTAVDSSPRPESRGREGSMVGRRLVADLMRDLGVSQAAAAGIVGNLAHESGDFNMLQELEPTVPGSRGGWGYAQWTGPRRDAMEAWTKERGLDPSGYDANYGYLLHELKNTPEGRVLEELHGVTDPSEATRIFSERFLRPGVPALNSRMRYTEGYLGDPTGWGLPQDDKAIPESDGLTPEQERKMAFYQQMSDALKGPKDTETIMPVAVGRAAPVEVNLMGIPEIP